VLMRCGDYIEWIARKLEGTLPEPQACELDEHLTRCSRCRAEILLQKRLMATLAQEPASELPADFTELVVHRAREIALEETRVPVWPTMLAALALVAGVTAVALAGADQLRALGSLSGSISRPLSPALAWIADAMGRVFGRASDLPTVQIPPMAPLSGTLERALAATLLASVPLVWGFYQVYAFLRD
jgi:anti-sigma factor RsiW